jgi:exosortase/archaeosortase family protein
MKKSNKLILRYLILVLIATPNLSLIYGVITPLTVYPTIWILQIIYPLAYLAKSSLTIYISEIEIEFIKACIAGSAYYLLLILNLTTPMQLRKRLKSISFILIGFLILNVIRILLLSVLAVNGSAYFSAVHSIGWYLGSTVFVVLLWFASTHFFKIKEIPIYTDLKFLSSKLKKSKEK